MQTERRLIAGDLEIRQDGDGLPTIRGHAAVFNRDSKPIMGMFIETIAPGAFTRAISEQQDVRALFNHDPSLILGRTTSGTLRLSEDAVGLAVEIDPPDTELGRSVVSSIRRGDVSQMSFGFIARDEEFIRGKGDDMDRRIVRDADLFDVSPVTFPAFEDTDIAVRQETRDAYSAWRKTTERMDAATAERLVALKKRC